MAWTWRYLTADGGAPAQGEPSSEQFPSRGDAESWLGEHWRTLSDGGVGRVALLDGDREVYEMSLEPVQ
ncbi:hypothetical protein [Nocardiopsis sp. LOL_012]|uniref:hypothetical protein n=1 Tax=Nocardiopsis sp. LOL_012 TaxID=3345409 RepID=UPI003A88D753